MNSDKDIRLKFAIRHRKPQETSEEQSETVTTKFG